MPQSKIRIGTRGSPLALIQAEQIRDGIIAAHNLPPEAAEVVVIKVLGDKIQDRKLNEFGGKGLFTKEIEDALIRGEISMAVHSMKDVPTVLPEGLEISCVLPREDPRDAFISLKYTSVADMPSGATIGTASLRRQAQVKRLRPDLDVVMFRGNVQTRMRKLGEGLADATFLAVSGLNRLGNRDMITETLDPDKMLPAIAQGAIGAEIRSNDDETRALLAPLHDTETETCIATERAFLARLDGSCRTPIAGLATLKGDLLDFSGEILLPDGTEHFTISTAGTGVLSAPLAAAIGREAGARLLEKAGPDFLETVARLS